MLSLRAPFTLPLRSLYNPSVYAVRTQPVRGLQVDSKRLVRPLKRPFRDFQRGTVYIIYTRRIFVRRSLDIVKFHNALPAEFVAVDRDEAV